MLIRAVRPSEILASNHCCQMSCVKMRLCSEEMFRESERSRCGKSRNFKISVCASRKAPTSAQAGLGKGMSMSLHLLSRGSSKVVYVAILKLLKCSRLSEHSVDGQVITTSLKSTVSVHQSFE